MIYANLYRKDLITGEPILVRRLVLSPRILAEEGPDAYWTLATMHEDAYRVAREEGLSYYQLAHTSSGFKLGTPLSLVHEV